MNMYYVKLSLYYVLSCARLLLLVVAAGLAYVFKHLHLASNTAESLVRDWELVKPTRKDDDDDDYYNDPDSLGI